MTCLLLCGNDKIGRRALARVGHLRNVQLALDASTNLKRVLKLILRRRISLVTLMKMYFAELRREDCNISGIETVENNKQLLDRIRNNDIRRVYLFRAGLIITRKILESGVEILNVHCARIPEYGGIGAIQRALNDKAFDQEVTLHRVTERIDEGEIIMTKPYRLSPKDNYFTAEELAYDCGTRLLISALETERR